MQKDKSNIVVYNDGELELKISVMMKLFGSHKLKYVIFLKKTKVLLADILIIFLKMRK